jgi:hypothetical protein
MSAQPTHLACQAPLSRVPCWPTFRIKAWHLTTPFTMIGMNASRLLFVTLSTADLALQVGLLTGAVFYVSVRRAMDRLDRALRAIPEEKLLSSLALPVAGLITGSAAAISVALVTGGRFLAGFGMFYASMALARSYVILDGGTPA